MKHTFTKTIIMSSFALPFLAFAQTATTNVGIKTPVTESAITTKTELTPAVMVDSKKAVVTDGSYTKLSLTDSMINWKATKTGGSHSGTVMLKEGVFTPDKMLGIRSGTFTIDMTSISATDLKDDADNKTKLEGHLKSADFFDVEKNLTAKFRVLKTVMLNKKTGAIQVIGNLTLKGKTRPVTFKAMQKIEDGKLVITSNEFKIDRTKFDVKFGSSLMAQIKDRFIQDNFNLTVKLVLTK